MARCIQADHVPPGPAETEALIQRGPQEAAGERAPHLGPAPRRAEPDPKLVLTECMEQGGRPLRWACLAIGATLVAALVFLGHAETSPGGPGATAPGGARQGPLAESSALRGLAANGSAPVFHAADGGFEIIDISAQVATDWKFAGAAVATNGKVVFAPAIADVIGVFDPADDSFRVVDISAHFTAYWGNVWKFHGAAAATNSRKVIFAPYGVNSVGVFDAADDSFELIDISKHVTREFHFNGAVTAANGKIVFVPSNADGVGLFDPADNSFVLFDISAQICSDFKFSSGAVAPDGKIVFAPYSGDGVGVFDPVHNTYEQFDLTGVGAGRRPAVGSKAVKGNLKYSGAVAANNGKIIFAPYSADSIGVWDPADSSFQIVNILDKIRGDYKFVGAATDGSGKIFFAPAKAAGVGVYDPSDDSFEVFDLSAHVGSAWKCNGAVAAGEGTKVILAPYDAQGVVVIHAGAKVFQG